MAGTRVVLCGHELPSERGKGGDRMHAIAVPTPDIMHEHTDVCQCGPHCLCS